MRSLLVLTILSSGSVAVAAPGALVGHVAIKTHGVFGWKAKSDRSGAVVYLEGVPGTAATHPAPPKMRQRDRVFMPRVIAVAMGTAVDFPNEDKIFHNVFSLSQVAKFDLGLYKSGTTKTVVFDRPGEVDVYCNIHPEMAATIKVLDTGYFALTNPDGSFRIDGIPPGTYPVVGWLPRSEEFHGKVTIKDSGEAQLDFELAETGGVPHHLRKDGTPYGRYE